MGPRRPGTKEIPGVHLDAAGRVLSHDIALQTHSVIQNIKSVLEDMGSGLEDVVDVSVFLTNISILASVVKGRPRPGFEPAIIRP